MKENDNIYFRARKNAAKYNERLYSREGAADMLGVSVSSLADYELGNTKVVPVDKVVLMADLYNCPELKTGYCKHECPIGKSMPIADCPRSLESVTIRLLKQLDIAKLNEIKNNLIDLADDGIISEGEKPRLAEILRQFDELSIAISGEAG